MYQHISLQDFWDNASSKAYLVLVNDEIGGIVMLIEKRHDTMHVIHIDEFFTMRKFRHPGIGKRIVTLLLETFPGKWELWIHPDNTGATQFWRETLVKIVGKDIDETQEMDKNILGTVFRFVSK